MPQDGGRNRRGRGGANGRAGAAGPAARLLWQRGIPAPVAPRPGPARGHSPARPCQRRTARARPGPAPRRQHRTARARPGTSHGSALAQAQDPAAWPWQGPPQGRLSSTEEPQAKLCLAEFPGADGSHSPARPSAGRSCSPVLAGPLPGDLGRRRANSWEEQTGSCGCGREAAATHLHGDGSAGRGAVPSTQKAWLYRF